MKSYFFQKFFGLKGVKFICFGKQQVVCEYECCHGFNDRYGARDDTGIVAAFSRYGYCFTRFIDGGLVLHDGSNRFEGYTEVDVLPVADAALDTTGMVGERMYFSVLLDKGIVVLGAA